MAAFVVCMPSMNIDVEVEVLSGDPPAERARRERMATPAAPALLRQRPGAAEWVNAQVRNRGLRRVLVRGLAKVRAVALWHALLHQPTAGQCPAGGGGRDPWPRGPGRPAYSY